MGRGCQNLQQGVAREQTDAVFDVVAMFSFAFDRAFPTHPGTSPTNFILDVLAPYFLARLNRQAFSGRKRASTWGKTTLVDPLSDVVP